MVDHTYRADFKYSHKNPYHDKLAGYSEFVLRDQEGEDLKGSWNKNAFKREAPLFVEIGSGYGHFMTEFCMKNPDINFVGMDYRFKRSFNLVKKLDKSPTKNFRYLRAKGERLEFLFSENEVDRIFYFFPDPWPKTRQHKRRLFQGPFLNSVYKVLKPGGEICIKTDHDGYAEWMCEVFSQDDRFEVLLNTNDLWNEHEGHFLTSFCTKFEKIFLGQNKNINAFVLKSKKDF